MIPIVDGSQGLYQDQGHVEGQGQNKGHVPDQDHGLGGEGPLLIPDEGDQGLVLEAEVGPHQEIGKTTEEAKANQDQNQKKKLS